MKTQITKPIFIGVINHIVTPNNKSVLFAQEWFKEIEPNYDIQIIDTVSLTSEQFLTTMTRLLQNRQDACIYFCIHGKQILNKETNLMEEFLKLNETNLIKDTEFTQWLNSLNLRHLYIYFEVCHSGGLINVLKADTPYIDEDYTFVAFATCAKDEKCYVNITEGPNGRTFGCASTFFAQNNINPFIMPNVAYVALKKAYPYLSPKVLEIRS